MNHEATDTIATLGQDVKVSPVGDPKLCKFLAIENWTKRDIPAADRLLGELVTTTTRIFLVGSTGLGKTLLALGMACGMASGRGFLHWRAERAARVLYIDGEMPAELIKTRSIDALRRLGGSRPRGNLFIFARDSEEEFAMMFPTLGRFAPLNTKEGKDFILELIKAIGGVDVVIFDNVMSLISGDQKDEVPWTETLPLVSELTSMRIGQIWADHTGHNKDRQYGSSTKAWRFDAVGLMAALQDDQKEQREVAFTLSFEAPGKARRRTPDNWQDFETRVIRLNDDRWTSEAAESGSAFKAAPKLSPTAKAFYAALMDALAVTDTPGRTTRTAWYAETVRVGLTQSVEPGDASKVKDQKTRLFRKYLSDLKVAGLIGINGDDITDLRKA
jgi:putative DNA primase/helicase